MTSENTELYGNKNTISSDLQITECLKTISNKFDTTINTDLPCDILINGNLAERAITAYKNLFHRTKDLRKIESAFHLTWQ